MLTFFVVNAVFLDAAAPTKTGDPMPAFTTERYQKIIGDRDIKIIAVNELSSGGIGDFSSIARGYVNMLNEVDSIYVNPTEVEHETEKTYLLTHEYAHILQKDLIAKTSDGYPSRWNPVLSTVFYANLVQLDSDLRAFIPPLREDYDGDILMTGLELNADCIAQALDVWPEDKSYTGHSLCNETQLGAAFSVINGEWPTEENVAYYSELISSGELQPRPFITMENLKDYPPMPHHPNGEPDKENPAYPNGKKANLG